MELPRAVRTGRQEDEMSNLAMMAFCRDLWTIGGAFFWQALAGCYATSVVTRRGKMALKGYAYAETIA